MTSWVRLNIIISDIDQIPHDKWRNLAVMFRVRLARYCADGKKAEFIKAATDLDLNETDIASLWDAVNKMIEK